MRLALGSSRAARDSRAGRRGRAARHRRRHRRRRLCGASRADAIIRFLMRDYTVRTSFNTSPDATVITVAIVASVGVAVARHGRGGRDRHPSRRPDAGRIAGPSRDRREPAGSWSARRSPHRS